MSAPPAAKLSNQTVHLLVGCEPASLHEGIALSPAVAGSIEDAARLVRDVVAQLNGVMPCA